MDVHSMSDEVLAALPADELQAPYEQHRAAGHFYKPAVIIMSDDAPAFNAAHLRHIVLLYGEEGVNWTSVLMIAGICETPG